MIVLELGKPAAGMTLSAEALNRAHLSLTLRTAARSLDAAVHEAAASIQADDAIRVAFDHAVQAQAKLAAAIANLK